MTSFNALIASPLGAVLVIAAMAAVTFFFRIAGVVLMSRVRVTPRVERGLRALPGSVILATILPAVMDNGLPAILALAAAIVTMVVTRIDLLALGAGLGTLAIIRVFL